MGEWGANGRAVQPGHGQRVDTGANWLEVLLRGADVDGAMGVFVFTHAPMAENPPHAHLNFMKILYVLEGEYEFRVGDCFLMRRLTVDHPPSGSGESAPKTAAFRARYDGEAVIHLLDARVSEQRLHSKGVDDVTTENNKATVEDWFETWNQRNWEKFTTFLSPQTELLTVATGEKLAGHDGWRQVWDLWNTGFPGHRLTITKMIADEEGAAVEAVFDGTHTGPFGTPAGDIPATGKSVHIPFVGYTQLDNGKVTSYHLYFDSMTVLTQLGAMPSPTAA